MMRCKVDVSGRVAVSRTVLLLSLLVLTALVSAEAAGRLRGEDGGISLAIAVPLTSDGENLPDPGWVFMMAAMLAVDHFNDRNPAVIEELAQPELATCPYKLVNVIVVDTGTNSHKAMQTLLQRVQDVGVVDAIAGPFNEQPGLELSVLATGIEAPMVAFRGLDESLVLPDKHPFFSQVYPDLNGEMDFVGKFLQHTNRTNYIAILHSNEDAVLQRVELLRTVLRQMKMDHVKTFSYQGVGKVQEGGDRGIAGAVSQISKTGYRTIVTIMVNPDLDAFEAGRAIHEEKLDRGDHFWVMVGGLDPSSSGKSEILGKLRYTPEGQFLQGTAFLYIFDKQYIFPNGTFQWEVLQQNDTFIQKLVDSNPVPNYYSGSDCAQNSRDCRLFGLPIREILQLPQLSDHNGFAYDAAMSVGIGACKAWQNLEGANSTAITGEQHVEGIQSADFRGVTGRVRFKNLPGTPGSRDGSSIYWGVLNLNRRDADDDTLSEGSMFLDPYSQEWVVDVPFEYADGTANPPLPLRRTPEQNYLNPVIRAVGLSLMSIALFTILASLVWVFVNSSHRVVIAAQPPFLYVLCLGSTLTALVILTQSFDESYGWNDEMLTRACLSLPWLALLGIMVTYSALFTKLWRVNKVLQFKRARIKVGQVIWPALGLFAVAVIILSVWTATTTFGWVRQEIDDVSGESIGRCQGSNSMAYLVPVDIIVFVPMALSGVMAWKTSDVDGMYAEGRWIFVLILVHLQVIIVGVPVIIILQNVSSTGRYIGLSLLVWTFPMSSMGLIFVPKMLAVRKEERGGMSSVKRGSSTDGVRVTGLNSSAGQGTSNEGQARSSDMSVTTQPVQVSAATSGPRIQTVTMY